MSVGVREPSERWAIKRGRSNVAVGLYVDELNNGGQQTSSVAKDSKIRTSQYRIILEHHSSNH